MTYVLELGNVDDTRAAAAGGKGARLGELSRIPGVRVPSGFCVTTDAFERVVSPRLALEDSSRIQGIIEGTPIPNDIAAEVTAAVERLGAELAYAVRSSATAEDLPTASFAGQHDSYLNIVGTADILQHVRRCWASLFTERAVAYRKRNGFDHHNVRMAVVVQRMVAPRASGVLFTADPVTGHRKVTSVEAVLGLGEALVSGHANADGYEVRDGAIISRTEHHAQRALEDAEVIELAKLGRRIEAYFGHPQDIEWCLTNDGFHIVQSRPITTLFPVPSVGDSDNHVYLSVGHQQMMTDAMKPLGISFWQLTARVPMATAGGRLFVDVTRTLSSPGGRTGLINAFLKSDPLSGDALRSIVDRGDFVPTIADVAPPAPPLGLPPAPADLDPAIVTTLREEAQSSLARLKREIRTRTGAELFELMVEDLEHLKRELTDPRSMQALMVGIESTWWLNDRLATWLGETNAADTLTQSAPGNVTSEMGLALVDVADVIRPHAEVVAFLGATSNERFLDELPKLAGGSEARAALEGFLDRYGMRCAGEIDITRPRWSEQPLSLLPILLGNIKSSEPGAGKRQFDRGEQLASRKEQELLERLRALPDGEEKARETKRMIDRVRAFIGYREFPKYAWMRRYFVYKTALMMEADRLVKAGVLRHREDIFYFTFAELHEIARTNRVDENLLEERQQAHRRHQALRPPRVLTSDGECIAGSYRRGALPANALAGLAVSGGSIEGRARVITNLSEATLEPGDILVTTATDPGWTPLFVAIKALVTEVGGLMTHGAVIAREYGLPAVVGVENATRLIRDGQRIRVDGTDGCVELLDPQS